MRASIQWTPWMHGCQGYLFFVGLGGGVVWWATCSSGYGLLLLGRVVQHTRNNNQYSVSVLHNGMEAKDFKNPAERPFYHWESRRPDEEVTWNENILQKFTSYCNSAVCIFTHILHHSFYEKPDKDDTTENRELHRQSVAQETKDVKVSTDGVLWRISITL